MTDEEKKRTVREHYDAWNRKDEEAVVAQLAADVRLIDVPTGQVLTGKEEAKERFRRWATAFPDGRVTIENLIVSGDTVVVQVRNEGTQRGPIGPFPPSNKRSQTRRVSILKFDPQGKIVEAEHYLDQLSMLQQLGHMPQPAAPARQAVKPRSGGDGLK